MVVRRGEGFEWDKDFKAERQDENAGPRGIEGDGEHALIRVNRATCFKKGFERAVSTGDDSCSNFVVRTDLGLEWYGTRSVQSGGGKLEPSGFALFQPWLDDLTVHEHPRLRQTVLPNDLIL